MFIGIIKENTQKEKRICLVPASCSKLIDSGMRLVIEKDLGLHLGISDKEFLKVGCKIEPDREKLISGCDMIVRINKPDLQEASLLKRGCIHISFLDPFKERQLLHVLTQNEISSISLEMIPRTTYAQKMDVLSSQASLSGYVAVILAAERLAKIFPMMTTPSGTIAPSRVFIVGAGVAGLQAIATAKRLGAVVEAFDTRSEVEEQVKSLGARFVKIDLGETGQTKEGYAKDLCDQQIQKQREAMKKICSNSDVVITTAQVFGKKAPLLITKEMIEAMKPMSVIVDMAVEGGGNVELSQADREIAHNQVKIIGLRNLPNRVSLVASQMISNNIVSLLEELWDQEKQTINLDTENEILKGCLISHKGSIINEKVEQAING